MNNRVVLVTGGGRGIGRACALAFAHAGVAGIAIAARSENEIMSVAREIESLGVRSLALPLDVTDEEMIREAPDRIADELGPVDILVGSAGIAESSPLVSTTTDLWQRTIAINLTGPFHLTRTFLPGMIERGWGRIVHVASIASKVGFPYVSAYCASKHGLLGLVRTAALEVAQNGVTVNAVCPGYVDTPMTNRSIGTITDRTGKSEKETRAYLENTNPQRRLLTPEEIAATVLHLAGENAAGINGQGLSICGGAT